MQPVYYHVCSVTDNDDLFPRFPRKHLGRIVHGLICFSEVNDSSIRVKRECTLVTDHFNISDNGYPKFICNCCLERNFYSTRCFRKTSILIPFLMSLFSSKIREQLCFRRQQWTVHSGQAQRRSTSKQRPRI